MGKSVTGRRLAAWVLAAALLPAAGRAAEAPYLAPPGVELTRYLPDPPAPGSPAEARDLAAVLEVQAERSDTGAADARLDQRVSILRFADVLGPAFNAGQQPLTVALGTRACREASRVVGAAKRHWRRPRPYAASEAVRPVAATSSDFSYPSGHATCGYLWAIVLADLVPEKRTALFERGRRYGENRVTGGVHYPSDVEAGRISAALIAAAMFANPAFRADLAAAKTELRRELGLGAAAARPAAAGAGVELAPAPAPGR